MRAAGFGLVPVPGPLATAGAVARRLAHARAARQRHVREYLPVRVRRRLRRWRGGLRVPSVPPVRGLRGLRPAKRLHFWDATAAKSAAPAAYPARDDLSAQPAAAAKAAAAAESAAAAYPR